MFTYGLFDRQPTVVATLVHGMPVAARGVPWEMAPERARTAARSDLDSRPRGSPVLWVDHWR